MFGGKRFEVLRRVQVVLASAMILAAAFGVPVPARATSGISGNQSGIWTVANSPYIVTGTVTVPEGQTLTIEPGVVVRFSYRTGLHVYGTLIAVGKSDQPIVFTSNLTNAAPGNWDYVRFKPNSAGRIEECSILFGGLAGGQNGALVIDSTGVTVRKCTIERSVSNGIQLVSAGIGPEIESVKLINNLQSGVFQNTVDMAPRYKGLQFSGNGYNGVSIVGATLTRAITLDGTRDAIGDGSITIESYLTVPLSRTLTILPGTQLRFSSEANINIYGTLIAEGTEQSPITFTSNLRLAAPGNWKTMFFYAGSTARLRYCTIRNGGGGVSPNAAIVIDSSNFEMRLCSVEQSINDGIFVRGIGISTTNYGISPTIDRVRFSNNRTAAIRTASLLNAPILRELIFTNNGIDGYVGPDGTLVSQSGKSATYGAMGGGLNSPVKTIATGVNPQPGAQPVYVGGEFANAGTGKLNFVGRWDPLSRGWIALGSGTNGPVNSLATQGSILFAGGRFAQAGTAKASNIARWDPTTGSWQSLNGGTSGEVRALAAAGQSVAPSGALVASETTTLFVGGTFTQAGGQSASNFAVYDSATMGWNAVSNGPNGPVLSIAAEGPTAYVGGSFTAAGGLTGTSGVAGYNSITGSWDRLGTGVNGTVNTIVVKDGLVYVGGSYTSAGGISATNVAVYDTQTGLWSALDSGTNGTVYTLAYGSDGLIAGGTFTEASGQSVGYVALFDGGQWRAVGGGTNGAVFSISPNGTDTYLGGSFTQSGGQSTSYVGQFGTGRPLVMLPGISVSRTHTDTVASKSTDLVVEPAPASGGYGIAW